MTVALGTNIANPISTALSQWLGFDTMGKLANYGKLGVTDPDAVIKALFANSEQGAWYDPSDLTTMFQDRAGTTPVTADGQTVGKILDKSGRGNHAVAPSDAARPLYNTSGGLHWLQFDGVDDLLSTAAINFTASTAISSFIGLNKASSAGVKQFFSTGANPTSSGAFGIYAPNGADLTFAGQFTPIGQGSLSGATASSYATGQKFTLSAFFDAINYSPNTSALKVKVNGGSVALTYGGAGASAASTFGNLPLTVGARDGAIIPFPGNMYPLIILGRLATTQEITDTETWVAAKTGVTL